MLRIVSLIALIGCLASVSLGDDWPQWRGPARDGVSKETGLIKQWPAGGPKLLWTSKEGGLGYSSFAVVGGTVYTLGARGDTEYLIALNVADGKQKWATPIGPILINNWGDGPRGTPTVDGEFVYALCASGTLICAKTSDGSPVWKTTMQSLGGAPPFWGYSESVLIDGDKVVCTPGGAKGAIAALNKKDGKAVWQSTAFTEAAQYASIIPTEHAGKKQYVQLTMKKLVGVDAQTGEVIWISEWPGGATAVIPTPIVRDGQVYITSGYNAGCKLVQLDGNPPKDVYVNKTMKNHHGGVVLIGDNLYGYSDGSGWICQNLKTGEQVWAEKAKLGKGCISSAEGMLYLVSESDGQVVMIEASPEGWKEHGRMKLDPQTQLRKPSGKIWTHPVIANGRLYLRDQEILFCFDIAGARQARAN